MIIADGPHIADVRVEDHFDGTHTIHIDTVYVLDVPLDYITVAFSEAPE